MRLWTLVQRVKVIDEGVPLEHFKGALTPGREIQIETTGHSDGRVTYRIVNEAGK